MNTMSASPVRVTTRQELDYVMRFHGIDTVSTFNGGRCLGSIVRGKDGALRYDAPQYGERWRNDDFAFRAAFRDVNDAIELAACSSTHASLAVVEHAERQTWVYPDTDGGNAVHHVFPRTVTHETESTWEGTYDALFERMYRANANLRYCNGHYMAFRDPHACHLYDIWRIVLPLSRGISMYYGGDVD